MHKKSLLFSLIFLLLSSIALAQECIIATEDMHLDHDATLCKQSYSLEKGITITRSSVVLDCNNASIRGPQGLGFGVLLRGVEQVTIRNCELSNLEAAIYLEDSENNVIGDNYIHNNRFGIVSFGEAKNTLLNNRLQDNSRSDEITISPAKMFEEEELTEEPRILEQKQEPSQIYERALRLKNPSMENAQVSDDVEAFFNDYVNFSNENLELRRTYFYNSTDNSTKVILRVIPKKPLLNVTIYEHIPKCMAKLINEISLDQSNYEVIAEDPLITWHFDSLTNQELLTYSVFKEIDDDCRDLLVSFGISTGYYEPKQEEPRKGIPYKLFAISIGVFVLILIIIFLRMRYDPNR
mgnify:CR=1 FL=1